MRTLPRHTIMLVDIILVGGIIVAGVPYIPRHALNEEKVTKNDYSYTVLKEDSELYAYGKQVVKSSQHYEKVELEIKPDARLLGYNLSGYQTFHKYMKFKAVSDQDRIAGDPATNVAYSLLLTGDLVQQTNKKTKQKRILVDNARITYLRIPYILDADNNEVKFINQSKEKREVSYSVFNDALSNLSIRTSILIRRSVEGVNTKNGTTSRLSEE